MRITHSIGADLSRRPSFEGLNGCGPGCGCGPCSLSGFGVLPEYPLLSTRDESKPSLLSVSNYVMSEGPYNPARMIEFLASAINGAGLEVGKPKVRVFPLTWAWRFSGEAKQWFPEVVSASSGPFEGEAPLFSGQQVVTKPTDTEGLPSHGNVITFDKIKVPAEHPLGPLLNLVRRAKVDATRGSNAVTSGTLRFKTSPAKAKASPVLVAGGSALAFVIFYNLFMQPTNLSFRV